jgi:hypothetical protein
LQSGITTEGHDSQDFDEFQPHIIKRVLINESPTTGGTIPGEDSKGPELTTFGSPADQIDITLQDVARPSSKQTNSAQRGLISS